MPLAKWSMLLTGNYRCILRKAAPVKDTCTAHRSIALGVQFGGRPAHQLGAKPNDLVPFEKYAAAALSLEQPLLGRARARRRRAQHRAGRPPSPGIAAQKGMRNAVVDETVALVDARLAVNRKAAA